MIRSIAGQCAITCALVVCSRDASAQGKSQQPQGQKRQTRPSGAQIASAGAPSRNELVAPAVTAASVGATPLAWVDDASIVEPGNVALAISAMRWTGSGFSEVDVPIVDATFGLAPRVQLSASVPRVAGSADPAGAVGGMGTTFFSAKAALYEHKKHSFKVAAAPTLQLLGEGVVPSLGPDEGRTRWGLPVSAEASRGRARVYGGGGYFSPGLWFAGAALSAQAAEKVFVSGGFSRAWRRTDVADIPLGERDRKEISGGAAYLVTPQVTAFASIGHTIRTLPENGAGTSILGGVSLLFASRRP